MTHASQTYQRQVYGLVGFYIVLLLAASGALGWVWMHTKTLQDLVPAEWLQPLVVPLLSAALGGAIGNVLYSIRVLYLHYIKLDDYDPRWLGKYLSGPFEAALFALIVYALTRGGVASLTGVSMAAVNAEQVATAEDTVILAAFGVGSLVGFSIRDVVGWLQNLSKTIFRHDETNGAGAVEPLVEHEPPAPVG